MADARAHIVVSGRVQGVFYRAFAEEVASSLELGGWARNMPDGRVEAVFEGEESAIEKALGMCRKGPPSSRVDDVEVRWEDYRGEFSSFAIRYF